MNLFNLLYEDNIQYKISNVTFNQVQKFIIDKYFPLILEEIAKMPRRKNYNWIALMNDKKLYALALLRDDDKEGFLYLDTIESRKDLQGTVKGMGKSLLTQIIQRAKSKYKGIRLQMYQENLVGFYSQFGFKKVVENTQDGNISYMVLEF
jgi:predicted GNAT family N-acyltransferase